MLDPTKANKSKRKKTLFSLLDVRSRKKAVIILCILFCATFFLFKLLAYDLYMVNRVCGNFHYPQTRMEKNINLPKNESKYITRTPGYRYFDNDLISPQNNVYLSRYKLHYCKIDKNMGSTM